MTDDEKAFRAWYGRMAAQYDLPDDPDDPSQFYDYRAAYRAGAKPDASKHWPSQFKKPGHPNEVVGGFNTRTGERVVGTKRANEVELRRLGWDEQSAKRLAAMPEPSGQSSLSDAIDAAVAKKRAAKPEVSLDDAIAAAIAAKTGQDQTRADGTAKGGGFFGTLKRPDGRVSTELSIGVNFDGKETEIPLLVPSLSKGEVDTLLSLGDKDPIPDAIADKAVKYAKLRMQAGKSVFAEPNEVGKFTPLPFAFDPNRQRKDSSVVAVGSGSKSAEPDAFGIDPEAVAMVGRAALTPVVGAASRVGASVKGAAGAAGPLVKYHVVNQGLRMLGAPGWLAESAGALAAGSRGGAKAAEKATATEAAAAETTPLGFPKTAQTAETPLEFSRRLKAEHQARTGRTKLEAPPQPAARSPLKVDPQEFATEFKKLAKTPKLTAEEMSIGAKLLQSGMKAEDVLEKLLKRREFPSSWLTLPTDADIAGTIGARNATGKWPQP